MTFRTPPRAWSWGGSANGRPATGAHAGSSAGSWACAAAAGSAAARTSAQATAQRRAGHGGGILSVRADGSGAYGGAAALAASASATWRRSSRRAIDSLWTSSGPSASRSVRIPA